MTVTLIKQEEVCPLLILSKLEVEVRYADETIQKTGHVNHWYFKGWPDSGIPEKEEEMVAFNTLAGNLAEYILMNYKTYTREMLITCQDGRGISGTLVAILAQTLMLRKDEKKKGGSIFNTVNWIRQYRCGLVENVTQYDFVFRYVELLKTHKAISFRDITSDLLMEGQGMTDLQTNFTDT